jgi:hypothetical protein
MKIYPGEHKIVQTQEVIPNIDIPLAYIDTVISDYKVSIIPTIPYRTFNSKNVVASYALTDSRNLVSYMPERSQVAPSFWMLDKQEVIPYTVFDSQDICLFDADGNLVDNSSILQRNSEGKYVYIPENAISFYPERFTYVVTGKKQMIYTSQKSYNIKIGCVDTPPELLFAKKLMKVFGDAPRRKISPTNIKVNNMDLSINSLIDSTIEENDFVFIESPDGKNYSAGGPIDIDGFLDKHTNVWLSVDDSTDFPIYHMDGPSTFKVTLPQIINSISYSTNNVFVLDNYTNQNYNSRNIFFKDNSSIESIYKNMSPILILESPKRGFLIITPKEFLNNIEFNVDLFYETLMYVYMNTYISAEGANEWITDKVPDFIVLDDKIIKKDNFTSQISLARTFGLAQNEVSLANIDIRNSNGDSIDYIKYVGMTSDYIIFDKTPTSDHNDPEKLPGYISIFTPRQNVIYFKDMLYLIQDNIRDKISYTIDGLNITINIDPFKSSINKINITDPTNIVMSLTRVINYKEKIMDHLDVCLYCSNNMISAKDKADYITADGTLIAELKIDLSDQNKIEILDMRQRGGGLAESEQPDYELLDIGHISGRPYREAGTLVITIPKRFEAYEDIILKAVKKHMVAEDLPIILFE